MRTQAEWQALIKDQQQSGQTATAFCNERGINPKYFSLKKKQLETATPKEGFVRVTPPAPKLSGITLSSGSISINLPPNCPSQWLAELVRALR